MDRSPLTPKPNSDVPAFKRDRSKIKRCALLMLNNPQRQSGNQGHSFKRLLGRAGHARPKLLTSLLDTHDAAQHRAVRLADRDYKRRAEGRRYRLRMIHGHR